MIDLWLLSKLLLITLLLRMLVLEILLRAFLGSIVLDNVVTGAGADANIVVVGIVVCKVATAYLLL